MELSSKLRLVMDIPSREENSDESKVVLMKDVIQQFIIESKAKADKQEIESCLSRII